MQCETCGKLIFSGKRVNIEGSIVVTCEECARYGKVVGEAVKEKKPAATAHPAAPQQRSVLDLLKKEIPEDELVDDYHAKVKAAREKKGWKQEELAKAINEPVSLIHHVESGHHKPSLGTVRKIEKKLGVKLIEKIGEGALAPSRSDFPKELTLGDVVVVKKK